MTEVVSPTELDIVAAVNEILVDCDVNTMTVKAIKLRLEEQFGCELPDCKGIIRTCLESFMDNNSDGMLYEAKVQNESKVDEDEPSNGKVVKKRGQWFTEFSH